MTEQDYAAKVLTLREAAQAMLAWTGEPYVNESCQICGAYEDEGHADCEAAALREALLAAPAPSEPWEPPLDATCPNCGFRFRFSPTDTYRNHRCPAPAPSEPCSCDWPGCQGQCHSGPTCPCHPTPAPSEPGLDAAWAEAEAALPEGWTLSVGHGPIRYTAIAERPSRGRVAGIGDTPAAALRALAARLRASGDAAPAPSEPGLDVETLARAMANETDTGTEDEKKASDLWGLLGERGRDEWRRRAKGVAAIYARLRGGQE